MQVKCMHQEILNSAEDSVSIASKQNSITRYVVMRFFPSAVNLDSSFCRDSVDRRFP